MGTFSAAAQGQVAQAIDAPQPGLGPRAVLVQARPKMAVTTWSPNHADQLAHLRGRATAVRGPVGGEILL